MTNVGLPRSTLRRNAASGDAWTAVAGSVLVVGVLLLTSQANFLLFHALAELISIAVAWSVFALTWNARTHIRDDTLMLLGTSIFFAANLDLVHTLAYKGMGVFPGYDANLPTQLWIAARGLQAVSFLAAFALLHLRPEGEPRVSHLTMAGYAGVTGLLIGLIFSRHFPTCYVEGVGLTPFKRISEYVISAILLVSGIFFWRARARYPADVALPMLVSIGATIVSELAFTFYVSVYGISSLAGHIFKLIAFAAIYLAIVRIGVKRPYTFLSQRLRQSEFRYRHVYEDVSLGIVQAGLDLHIENVNPAVSQMFGYAESELAGQPLTAFVLEGGVATAESWLRQLLTGADGHSRADVRLIRKDGRELPAIVTGSLARDGEGRPLNLLLSLVDITELKEAEAERERLLARVQEQAQRMEHILATVPAGVMVVNADGSVLAANPLAEEALPELAVFTPDRRIERLGGCSLTTVLNPRASAWLEIEGDGRVFEAAARPLPALPGPASYVVVLSDVTEARQVRAELAQQARLAAVGQLAAGIAHDFNNILASILIYADMDTRQPGLPEPYRSHMVVIQRESRRAAHLVQQILDFGRRSILASGQVDVVSLVEEQVALLRRMLPEDIIVGTRLSDESLLVEADASRMQQILVNLATNARDAMPEGGRMWVEVWARRYPTPESVPLPEMRPGDWVELAVSDTGTGITAEVMSHIYEPFFTTKPPGQGSGLGLPQVYGIVQQHSGHIHIESEVGVGTTVRVFLPRVWGDQDNVLAGGEEALPEGARETVLVVEDDPTVRAAIAAAVSSLDYQVVDVSNGLEALALLRGGADGQPGCFSAILCDVVMPTMGGRRLFEAIQELELGVPVILISGHPMDARISTLASGGLAGWLPKPLNLTDLAHLLAKVVRDGA